MSAFLKLDRCAKCATDFPWEWVPPVMIGSRTLAGTGVWRSALWDGKCATCSEATSHERSRDSRIRQLRTDFARLVGGPRAAREFTFDTYRVAKVNQAAFEKARFFDPASHNIYLLGPTRTGKTHLAVAILRAGSRVADAC